MGKYFVRGTLSTRCGWSAQPAAGRSQGTASGGSAVRSPGAPTGGPVGRAGPGQGSAAGLAPDPTGEAGGIACGASASPAARQRLRLGKGRSHQRATRVTRAAAEKTPPPAGPPTSGTAGAGCVPLAAPRPATRPFPGRPVGAPLVRHRPPTPAQAAAAIQTRVAAGKAAASPVGRAVAQKTDPGDSAREPSEPGRCGNPRPAFQIGAQPSQSCPGQEQ